MQPGQADRHRAEHGAGPGGGPAGRAEALFLFLCAGLFSKEAVRRNSVLLYVSEESQVGSLAGSPMSRAQLPAVQLACCSVIKYLGLLLWGSL
jgi:hypothetical protein